MDFLYSLWPLFTVYGLVGVINSCQSTVNVMTSLVDRCTSWPVYCWAVTTLMRKCDMVDCIKTRSGFATNFQAYGSHRGSFWSTEFDLEHTFSIGKSRDQDHPTITNWKSVCLTRFLCKKMSLCGFRTGPSYAMDLYQWCAGCTHLSYKSSFIFRCTI